jgi:hypothetical protein
VVAASAAEFAYTSASAANAAADGAAAPAEKKSGGGFFGKKGGLFGKKAPPKEESSDAAGWRETTRLLTHAAGLSGADVTAIGALLTAMLTLGNVTFAPKTNGQGEAVAAVANADVMQRAARLLGVSAATVRHLT